MNPTTLNLLAISVFAFTMLSLVGPLINISPGAVAIALSGIAGVIAIDRFGAQGKGGNLLVDLVSRQSSEYRQRILHHEAGHFLVAHLLDIPVQSYTLSAWEATKAGMPGLGGVVLDTAAIEAELATGTLSAQQINRYCILWMAGIAAETQTYGSAAGGEDDQMKLRLLWQQTQRTAAATETQIRWALLQAQTLLEKQKDAYNALVTAMSERASVESCLQIIEANRVETSKVEASGIG
ncbi:ATP-dependent Zn protease [cf. Phormidesmis sp. LEGE 11477]|uniref:ATP-dependent Zn protease n=1 Tax=cf. Phormidesmis sp. LEGE 11477 TaxID=1828680 RepID=UPI00187EFC00|nr:ATP-dependent Zn protease [cf. Phormidesmis sp. LEGE 11477]MBE9059793.1 ATP-dependent Zn protease [cf. Phormidesmis sp. LEGE 11477]